MRETMRNQEETKRNKEKPGENRRETKRNHRNHKKQGEKLEQTETVGTYEKLAKIGETMIKQEKPGGKL